MLQTIEGVEGEVLVKTVAERLNQGRGVGGLQEECFLGKIQKNKLPSLFFFFSCGI